MSHPDPAIVDFVRRTELVAAGDAPAFTALSGGVSSDIWLVETPARRFAVKRALPALRVAADWQVPVERNVYEAAWLRGAGSALADAVPEVLAADPAGGLLAMAYLPPDRFRWWKGDLLAGRTDPAVAAAVGERLGRIHAAFAVDPSAPATFASDAIFHAIRLEPYLTHTGRVHPALAHRLEALCARTAATRRTVVHGDVSPKNILVGPRGPVFIDAECAWYGDPAFDLAFCLNHMLLKCLASPQALSAHLASFDALRDAYLARVDWEPPAELEARAAALLPALFLGRIDGKSPVEYITDDRDRDAVRRTAAPLIASPPDCLAATRDAWAVTLRDHLKGPAP